VKHGPFTDITYTAWTSFTSDVHCLRQITGKNGKIPNMEVLEHCMTTGIEAMLVQAQLRWSGHLVHMSDTRLPTLKKAIFYSQLASGSRPSGHPVKWYKMH